MHTLSKAGPCIQSTTAAACASSRLTTSESHVAGWMCLPYCMLPSPGIYKALWSIQRAVSSSATTEFNTARSASTAHAAACCSRHRL